MAHPPPPDDLCDRLAVASYVAALSGDLATMARNTGLQTLSYLLEMVHLEAVNESRQAGDSAGPWDARY
jgi:hypothetical protein